MAPERPLRPPSRDVPFLVAAGAIVIVLVAAIAIGQSLRRDQSGGVGASPTATTSPSASPSSSLTATPSPSPTTSPTGTPIVLPAPAQLSAPSRDLVWAIVGGTRLFRSTDRGTDWEERPLPSGLANVEIAFANDREGWISSVGSPATQCQTQSIALWHTADGGANWDRLSSTGIADAQCKSRLSFTDASHGFIVASDPNHAPIVYRTSDGGKAWSASRALADPPSVTTGPGGSELQPGRVRAFGSTLLVPVAGPGAGGGQGQYAYRSTDAGATWTFAAKAPNGDGIVALLTDTRWLELVIPNGSQVTTDAGKTWQPFQSDYSQAAPVAPELVFGDASVGYATIPSRGSIQRTTDGGAHWSAIKTPGTS